MKLRLAVLSSPIALLGLVPIAIAAPADVERLLKTNQCPRCNLQGADLKQANLFGANLVGSDLRGADLSGAHLGSANLTDANLSGAKLVNAYLHQTLLEGTDLSQADLTNAYLREAQFNNTNLKGASLRQVTLNRSNLSGVDLQAADLSGANLSQSLFTGPVAGIEPGMRAGLLGVGYLRQALCEANFGQNPNSMRDADRYGIAFAKLQGANLSGANLSGAVFSSGDLSGANLTGANLTQSCLGYARLTNARFTGANLEGARLRGAIVAGADFQQAQGADLAETYQSVEAVEASRHQIEARQYIGSMNRGQQAYYLERSRFARRIQDLGLGIRSETQAYRYQILPMGNGTRATAAIARPKNPELKTYLGIVSIRKGRQNQEDTSVGVLCESLQPNAAAPSLAVPNPSAAPTCPTGYRQFR